VGIDGRYREIGAGVNAWTVCVAASQRLDAGGELSMKRRFLECGSLLKKSGNFLTSAKRTLSKDGKVMTLTIASTNAKGEKTSNVAVYHKQ
jgi:hypothetical protein